MMTERSGKTNIVGGQGHGRLEGIEVRPSKAGVSIRLLSKSTTLSLLWTTRKRGRCAAGNGGFELRKWSSWGGIGFGGSILVHEVIFLRFKVDSLYISAGHG